MNLLIVDDQKTIVKGLRDGIDWKAAGIDEVHTACSARGEACADELRC